MSRNTLHALLACLALTVAPATAPAGAASGQVAPATCAGVPATIVGTDGDDALTGTPGDDVIVALDGADTVDAGAGNDLVCGDAGPDSLLGGAGDDRLHGGTNGLVPVLEGEPEPVGDTIAPGPGDDLVDLGVNTVLRGDGWNAADTIDYSASATGVTVDLVSGVATGEGADTLVVAQPQPATGFVVELLGSTHADHLLGTEGSDRLIGKGGGDRIEARGGDDEVTNNWDQYEYDPQRDGTEDDLFDGGAGDDYLDSAGGTDVLLGGDGKDHLRKDGGRATLDGGAGRDQLEIHLSKGRHTLSGGAGRDQLSLSVLNSGRTTRGVMDHARERFTAHLARRPAVHAAVLDVERVRMPYDLAHWTYLGTRGDDRVVGFAAYTARGRGGDDVLIGSRADDVLLGGPGHDRVVGRAGDDRCRGEDLAGCERAASAGS